MKLFNPSKVEIVLEFFEENQTVCFLSVGRVAYINGSVAYITATESYRPLARILAHSGTMKTPLRAV